MFARSRRLQLLLVAVLVYVSAAKACLAEDFAETFEGWNLEPSLQQAHLVMVARVTSVGKVTVIEGAKTDVALRSFRFQPVRRLKGLFNRDELAMTASDLGIVAQDSAAPPLKEGEFRLLILSQQRGFEFGVPTFGCVSAAPGVTTFAQRLPLLTGPDDPLVGVVETLIKVADSRSRKERATLVIDQLASADGVSATPLLTSLKHRADWVAMDGRAFSPLARLAGSQQSSVRRAAVDVLSAALAIKKVQLEQQTRDDLAKSIVEILKSDEADTSVRTGAIESLGSLLALEADFDNSHELLAAQLTEAGTNAERAAAATALAQRTPSESLGALLDAYKKLPLDEQPAREVIYTAALERYLPDEKTRKFLGDLPGSERAIIARLKRSLAARQSLETEVDALGRMGSKSSLALLLSAATDPSVSDADRQHIAVALGRLKNDEAVPILAGWLRGANFNLKEPALAALEAIDSELAVKEVQPLLRTEGNLPYKLRIARLLARHGMTDGYALATEHLADDEHTASAALVLAALDDPRTAKDLTAIVDARPDRRWLAAALTGLVAIGDSAGRKQVLEILNDDRNPLAADAAEAVGVSSDTKLLPPLAKLVQSRNRQIARAALLAIRRFLSGVRMSPEGLTAVNSESAETVDAKSQERAVDVPAETRAALAEAVASLVADTYVEADTRLEAFAVLRLLGGERFSDTLAKLSDQAELEGSPLLEAVNAERRR